MVAIFTGAGTGFERGSGNVIGGAGLLGSAAQGRGGDNIFLNAANGNLLINRQDEFLSGRGPDVGITRTYNSLGNFSDDNGDNWRQSMDRQLYGLAGPLNDWGSTVVRRSGDGTETIYSWNGAAYITTDGSGAYDRITYDGTWRWQDGDSQITEVYGGPDNRLSQIVDTSGNSLTFTYTGDKLTRVTTADGGYTEINWSGSNIYALYTYSHGTGLTRTRYSYDGDNRLSTVTVDLTPNDTTVGDGNVYTTTYTYHGTSKLVATISQTDGSYVAFGYDGSNRVTSIAQTVASGVTRTTGIAYGSGTTTVTDPMGQSTTLHYDGAGQLTRITAPPATAGAAPQTVEFGYNANGDLIRTTDAGGKVTSYTYDASGNVLTRSDATSVAISSGINAIATLQPDGTYRVTKTNGSSGTYDSQVQSAQGISGDFVFRMRPLQTDKYVLAGVSQNPNASLNYTNLDFAIEAAANGYMYHYDNGVYAQLTSYVAGDSLWMVRSGSTLSYYKGDTLEAAKAAGALRTVNGVSGTFYADAALYTIGAVADMSLTPTSIEESFNVVTRTYNAANQVLTETRMGSDRNSANAAHTTRYVYDSLNRLTYVVSAEGYVTRNWYDGYGQRYWTNDFPDHLYDVSGLAPNDPISDATLNSWAATLGDTSSSQISFVTHDARGNVSLLRTATQNNSFGSMGYAEGYRDEFFTYDQSGRLLSRRTASQNSEYFAYDGLGRVTSSTDLNGGVTNIYFNDAATQTTVTLAGGLVRTTTYSKAGELLSVTEGGAYATGGTASNVHDLNGRLRSTTDATGVTHYYLYDKAGRKTAEVDEYGNLIEYRYDARDRLVATARFALQVSGAHLALVADPSSSIDVATIRPTEHAYDIWTWHVYDADGRVLQAIDGDGSTTSYDYDASGQLIRTTGYYNKLTAAQIAAFKVAAPASVILPAADARDAIARAFYDKDGRSIGALDGAGYLSRIAYDRAGRKVKEVAYAKATDPALRASGTFQQLTDSTNPNPNPANRQMNYVYDGQGLLRYQIDGLGQVTEYGYESEVAWGAIGLVRKVTVYATAISFPSGLTFAAVKAAIASSGAAGNAANRTSWAVHDTAGRVAYAIDAGGAVTGFSYDTSGRVTRKVAYATLRATTSLPTQADMNAWASANPAATDRTTRHYYDAMGQLRLTIDPENYVTRSDYDAEGRISATYRYDTTVSPSDSWTIAEAFGALSGTHTSSSFSYNAVGQLSETQNGEGERTAYVYYATGKLAYEYTGYGTPDQSWTIHVYDAAGRKTHHYAAYDTPEQALTQYVYDGLGNLVLVSDPLNRTTTYTHDSLGRVLTQTDAASGTVSYQYNAFGDVVRTTDQRGNSTYNYYDNYGRILSSRDAENYVTETRYTAFGEIANITRRFSRATGTPSVDALPSYDAHASDATTTFAYDKLGRVISTKDAEEKTEYRSYDAFGNVARAENKLGGVVYYAYNRRGELTHDYVAAPVYDSIGNQLASGYYRYINYYDARGNLTHKIEAYSLPEQRDTTYTYDKADRLIAKTGASVKTGLSGTETIPVETYAYDKRGNLIETKMESIVGSTRTPISRTLFYYDDLDRKVAQIDATGAVTQYFYDAAGNLKQTRAFDALVTLPATPGGTAPLPGGNARDTYFNYDGLNRLTSSYTNVGRTGYWNGAMFVVTQNDTATTYYEYDAAGNVIKTTDPNGATTFSYYDKLGRKTHEVDRENFLTKWEYDAEGNVLTERRYAIQGSTPTTAAPPVISETTSDRVTLFSYDKLGRRLTETRYGVEAWSIDAGTGTLTADNRSATITYTYNALGQVLTKTEANSDTATGYSGDKTSYQYDNAGRLIMEQRASYAQFGGGDATPELRYFYNGLDQLVRTYQPGYSSLVTNRATANTYEDGRLTSSTDASGFTRNYHYDAAGRLVAESYVRMLSTGSTVLTALIYEHDAAGRVITQTYAQHNGTSWVHTDFNGDTYDATRMRYNAHGELTGRGITAGHTTAAVYQEYYDYDASGRVLRSNAGDGVVKYFAYDRAGNQTLTLTSEGSEDLTAINYADLLDSIAGGTDTNLAGIAATLTVYDKRGMVTQTRDPGRQLSVGSSEVTLIRGRTYNAFGEVLSETDARGYTTSFAYNNMGRLLRKESPTVKIVHEHGGAQWIKPSEDYYYDISGRLIGTRDANGAYGTYGIDGTTENAPAVKQANTGNLTTRLLLAGTGHGGSEALTTKEFRADSSVFQTLYDAFGDARILRNEFYYRDPVTGVDNAAVTDERHDYDGMGRVTQIIRRNNPGNGQLTEYFGYDGLGQRIWQSNSFQGAGNKARTDYDAQGRIYATVAIGGDSTATRYVWDGTIVTGGLGTFGGWKQTTTYANGRTSVEHSDMFDHMVWKQDLGSNATTLAYDKAGRQTLTSVSGGWSNILYFNTGQISNISSHAGMSSYSYDAAGNRLTEHLQNGGVTVKNQTAIYDALGRLKSWSEAGSATSPAASTSHEYDANGNIRRTQVSQSILNASGWVASTQTQDHWFSFNSMNRLVTDKGQLSGAAGAAGTTIVRGATGSTLTYDAAGQRKTSTQTRSWSIEGLYYYGGGSSMFSGENGFYTADIFEQYQYYSGYWSAIGGYSVDGAVEESYEYSSTGNLLSVRQKKPNVIVYGTVTVDNDNPVYTSTSQFAYDALGRQTYQHDYAEDGVTIVFQRTAAYNAKGQMLTDDSYTIRTDGYLYRSVSEYSYTDQATGEYLLGAVGVITTTNYRNGIDDGSNGAPDPQTVYHYRWFDAAMQSSSTYDNDTDYVTNPIYTTSYNYNAFGQLTSINIGGDKSRTVTFTHDELGRVIRRDESNIAGQVGAPHEVWYHFGGRQMGYTGNNGTDDLDYISSVHSRQTRAPDNPGTFRNSGTGAYSHADFVNSSDPINSYSQGSTAGRYTARAGDTLASIAAQIYGDASLAYKIAQANGMSTGVSLIEGQSLTLPSGVMRNTYNASTFKPYDPSEVVGDLSPTLPKPPKKKGCGVLGQVLMMVVAIAVTAILKAPVAKLFAGLGKVGGAIATGATLGAVSNVASQGFGVAAGIQDKFNWGAVGLAAVSGGIGGGMGAQFENGILGKVSGSTFVNNFANAAAFGAVHGVISQGIGVATGLQHKFDWAGVAAGAVGGGLSTAVGGGRFVSPAVDGIASAAARSLITGTSFGDNIIAVLPGVIGRTIGNLMADGIASISRRSEVSKHGSKLDVLDDSGDARRLYDRLIERGMDPAKAFSAASDPKIRAIGVQLPVLESKVQDGTLALLPGPSGGSTKTGFDRQDGTREEYLVTDNFALKVQRLLGEANSSLAELDQKYGVGTAIEFIDTIRNPAGALLSLADQLSGNLVGSAVEGFKDTAADGILALSLGGTATGGYVKEQRSRTDAQIEKEIAAPDQERAKAQANNFKTDHSGAKLLVDVLTGIGGTAGGIAVVGGRRGPEALETTLPNVPGRVQSRINLMNGSQAQGAGWNHVVADHFNPAKGGKSQFTVSKSELRDILQSKEVVGSPVVRILASNKGPRYVREVTLDGRNIGVDVMTKSPTSTFTIMSDKYGNLITTFPGRVK